MKLTEITLLELKALFGRKRPAALLLFGIPILYSLLFGYVYRSNVIKNIPTVIYDQDQTATSRALTQAYMDSERYQVVDQVMTQEAMEQSLRENRAQVAISIPPRFAQNIKLGLASEILIVTNSVNNMYANTVISSSQEIIQTFSAATGQKLLEGINQMPASALRSVAPVKLGVRIINNPTTSYTNFMLAGLMANGVQIAILLVAGPLLVREYGRLSRWQTTSSTALVTGKLLACWISALGAFLASLGIIAVFFGVPVRGNPASLILLGSAFTFLVVNISLFFSAIAKNEVSALQTPLLYLMPGLLFSGLSWPQFAMNDFARFFSALMPLTYLADTLRDLTLAGYSPALLKNIAIMFAGGLGFYLSTIFVFAQRRNKLANPPAKEVLV
ncbi:ABC transporter permease [Sporomusa aerivorans]|uniref:ABC transporter permease n=1 Tax=Sporomusa aerivorans TaxID=204936 RepID=UPI00352A636F